MAEEEQLQKKLEEKEATITHLRNQLGVVRQAYADDLERVLRAEEEKHASEREAFLEKIFRLQSIETLGILVQGFIHDLRGVHMVTSTYLDLIAQQASLAKVQRDYLETAQGACSQTGKLIEDFRSFSKGGLAEKKVVDVYEIATQVFALFKTETRIKKNINLEPGKYFAFTNPVALNRVMLNLVTNSIKAIRGRGERQGDYFRILGEEYSVAAPDSKGLAAGKYIHLVFEDNGKGMSEDIKAQAFNPFYTTREDKKGHGLGLYMVHYFIKKNGGCINLESEVGKGTKFHIYLPKAEKPV